MSGAEEAGALATAGLAAAALDKAERKGEAHGACLNCGATLTGAYCANCGQPAHVHRSLLHLAEETLHGVAHFDTKAWRTLPKLAFRPGTLTREYIEGRRARYVSPLALFLFAVFLMFFVFALTGGPQVGVGEGFRSEASAADIAEAESELARAQAALKEAEAEGGAEAALIGPRMAVRAAEQQVQRMKGGEAEPPGETWQEELKAANADGRIQIELGNPALEKRIRKKLENPDLALYKIQQAAYKFSFLLVPLSIPFVWLLFAWRRGHTWFDHGVFVLYSLSFMAFLFLTVATLGRMGDWTEAVTGPLLVFGPPVHMFFQLGGAYRLSVGSALWRTVVLMTFSAICLVLFVALIVILGLSG